MHAATVIRSSLFIVTVLGFSACGGERTNELDQMRAQALEQAVDQCSANPAKVYVCHIPPGNPANWHTICISNNAVSTHESHHGDTIGATCEGLPDDDGDDMPDDGDGDPPDTDDPTDPRNPDDPSDESPDAPYTPSDIPESLPPGGSGDPAD